jgi:hypothetical protein
MVRGVWAKVVDPIEETNASARHGASLFMVVRPSLIYPSFDRRGRRERLGFSRGAS